MSLKVMAIGTSAGGVDALRKILPGLTLDNLAVLLVLHMPSYGPNLLPELFQDICSYKIKEADSGEPILPRHVYVAPPDYHLSAEANQTLSLSTEAPLNFSRPSIDILMESVALAFGPHAIGLLLTGSNEDGSKGMFCIHRHEGKTIVQDPLSADYPTMPNACFSLFEPDLIGDLDKIKLTLSDSDFLGVSHG